MEKRAKELTSLFIRLLILNDCIKIPDKGFIHKEYIKLLKFHSFLELWDATHYALEDPFWCKNIKSMSKFVKHVEQLVEKGKDYLAPIPIDPEGYTAEQLIINHKTIPTKSLLQLHQERMLCQRTRT